MLPRRQRRRVLTPAAQAVLARLVPGLTVMNDKLLQRLDETERVEFMRLLRKFVPLNKDQSRAPAVAPGSRRGAARRGVSCGHAVLR